MRQETTFHIIFIFVFSATLLFIAFLYPAHGFYEWENDDRFIDVRGLMRGFGTAFKNPENNFFYEDKSTSGVAALLRLLMQAQAGQHLSFEVNVYQTHIPPSLVSPQSDFGASLDVERSSALEWSFSDDNYVHLAIDRLNFRMSGNHFDLIIGRQPINLATTFYFTPNDFFAPFAAQSFYRVYKPGVDAVRAEVRLGDLSQLSLISVLGYTPDPDSDTGWSDESERDRASYIGRISTVFHDFEWALLGGMVCEAKIIGGSLQGELFQWLGVRTEGHVAAPDDTGRDSYLELSVGVEHRCENSLDLRLEQYYHGSGASSVSDYDTKPAAVQGESTYLGRNYTALGVGYEFTPLVKAEMLAMTNLTDHSYLLSFNATYSLSNEAELAFNLGVPVGKKPEGAEIKSEFGLYPYSVNVEVRWYF